MPQFRDGEAVWAKSRGFSWWPALAFSSQKKAEEYVGDSLKGEFSVDHRTQRLVYYLDSLNCDVVSLDGASNGRDGIKSFKDNIAFAGKKQKSSYQSSFVKACEQAAMMQGCAVLVKQALDGCKKPPQPAKVKATNNKTPVSGQKRPAPHAAVPTATTAAGGTNSAGMDSVPGAAPIAPLRKRTRSDSVVTGSAKVAAQTTPAGAPSAATLASASSTRRRRTRLTPKSDASGRSAAGISPAVAAAAASAAAPLGPAVASSTHTRAQPSRATFASPDCTAASACKVPASAAAAVRPVTAELTRHEVYMKVANTLGLLARKEDVAARGRCGACLVSADGERIIGSGYDHANERSSGAFVCGAEQVALLSVVDKRDLPGSVLYIDQCPREPIVAQMLVQAGVEAVYFAQTIGPRETNKARSEVKECRALFDAASITLTQTPCSSV